LARGIADVGIPYICNSNSQACKLSKLSNLGQCLLEFLSQRLTSDYNELTSANTSWIDSIEIMGEKLITLLGDKIFIAIIFFYSFIFLNLKTSILHLIIYIKSLYN